MQFVDIAFDHFLEQFFAVVGCEKGKIEILSNGGGTWQQWMHLQQNTLERQPE